MTSPLRTRELKSTLSLAMLPETWDPTCTVTTALMVPVASTTSWIAPRSTSAVKYCAWARPCARRTTSRTATATRPATTIHRRRVILMSTSSFSSALRHS